MMPALFDMCFASDTFHMKVTDGGNAKPPKSSLYKTCSTSLGKCNNKKDVSTHKATGSGQLGLTVGAAGMVFKNKLSFPPGQPDVYSD